MWIYAFLKIGGMIDFEIKVIFPVSKGKNLHIKCKWLNWNQQYPIILHVQV